jgi:MOSC domain-containing protein YiiM
MGEWGSSFRACLEVVLGGAFGVLPEPASMDDEETFWRQWLAQHNLGLVPVAEPQSFAWAGAWIAVFAGDAGRRHPVLMFGVPSGPILDLDAAVDGRPAFAEAYVVAPLDLRLDRVRPYDSTAAGTATGIVEALLVAPRAREPLTRVESARALPGRGLEGDRYALDRGTFSGGKGKGYDLTLIESEALGALEDDGVSISWEEARRNVVTRGIDLNALVGKRFWIGEVECFAQRLAEPCAHLEDLTRPGVLRGLVHRAGVRADILSDGVVRVGDHVRAERL